MTWSVPVFSHSMFLVEKMESGMCCLDLHMAKHNHSPAKKIQHHAVLAIPESEGMDTEIGKHGRHHR